MPTLTELLLPQLRAVPPAERDAALRNARSTSFDFIELVGIAFGLVLTVSVTRYSVDATQIVERAAAALLNLLVAVPLLTLLVGPFLVRRLRRGLDQQVNGRGER